MAESVFRSDSAQSLPDALNDQAGIQAVGDGIIALMKSVGNSLLCAGEKNAELTVLMAGLKDFFQGSLKTGIGKITGDTHGDGKVKGADEDAVNTFQADDFFDMFKGACCFTLRNQENPVIMMSMTDRFRS